VQLHPNVPNPFNPHTMVRYELPREMRVQLAVYDLRGGLVKTLVSDTVGAGIHEEAWNGRDDHGRPVASGIYVVRLQAEGILQSNKVTLVR
jgi:flagellar hook assembly protein FlgD